MSGYRPDPKPHLARTAVILVLLGAVLFATVSAVLEISESHVPPSVVRPSWHPLNNPTPQGTVPPYDPEVVWGK